MIHVDSPEPLSSFCRHATLFFEKADGVCTMSFFSNRVCIDIESHCHTVCARFECSCSHGPEDEMTAYVEATSLAYVFGFYKAGGSIELKIENGTLVTLFQEAVSMTSWCIPLHMDEQRHLDHRFSSACIASFPLQIHTLSSAISNSDRIQLVCTAPGGCVTFKVPKNHNYNPGGVGSCIVAARSIVGDPFCVVCKWKFLSKACTLFHKKCEPTCSIDATQTMIVLRATIQDKWKCVVSITTLDKDEF